MLYVIPTRKYVLEVAARIGFFRHERSAAATLVGIGNAHFWILWPFCRCVLSISTIFLGS